MPEATVMGEAFPIAIFALVLGAHPPRISFVDAAIAGNVEREFRRTLRRDRPTVNSWMMFGLRAAIAALVLVTGSVALSGCERRPMEGQSQIADGVRFEYGAVPSSVPAEHPTNHPEATMHSGAPRVENSYHIVLGIFDKPSGARITDANVVMRTSGPGHPGIVETQLEPMSVNGDMSYGGYIALPNVAKYRLTFKVRRPGRSGATAVFLFDRPQ
jgi:hypothetical protein